MKKLVTNLPAIALQAFAIAFVANAQSAPQAWKTAFLNDVSSGISPTKNYTHAIDFYMAPQESDAPIYGVMFQRTWGTTSNGQTSGSRVAAFDGREYFWSGVPARKYNQSVFVIPSPNEVRQLLFHFAYADSTNPQRIVLSNLIPRLPYEVVLYFARYGGSGSSDIEFEAHGVLKSQWVNINHDTNEKGDQMLVCRYLAKDDGTLAINTKVASGTRGLFLWALTNEALNDFALFEPSVQSHANVVLSAFYARNLGVTPDIAAYWAPDGAYCGTDANLWQAGGSATAVLDNGVWNVNATTGLKSSTLYNYRFVASTNGVVVGWSELDSFTTFAGPPPTLFMVR